MGLNHWIIRKWQTPSQNHFAAVSMATIQVGPHICWLPLTAAGAAVGHLMNPIKPTPSATQDQMTAEMLNKIEGPAFPSSCHFPRPPSHSPQPTAPGRALWKVSYIESRRPRMVLHIKKINACQGVGAGNGSKCAMFARLTAVNGMDVGFPLLTRNIYYLPSHLKPAPDQPVPVFILSSSK